MSAKERFCEHLLKSKKKGTYKSYKRGLELFLEWYGKDSDEVLAERKADIVSARTRAIRSQIICTEIGVKFG